MKTKTVETPTIMYVCEVCGKEAKYPLEITHCEERHRHQNCQHEDTRFEVEYCNDAQIWFRKTCRTCKKEFSTAGIEPELLADILKDHQEICEKIWEDLNLR
jgi:hypothetical protein